MLHNDRVTYMAYGVYINNHFSTTPRYSIYMRNWFYPHGPAKDYRIEVSHHHTLEFANPAAVGVFREIKVWYTFYVCYCIFLRCYFCGLKHRYTTESWQQDVAQIAKKIDSVLNPGPSYNHHTKRLAHRGQKTWSPSQYKDRLSHVWGFPC